MCVKWREEIRAFHDPSCFVLRKYSGRRLEKKRVRRRERKRDRGRREMSFSVNPVLSGCLKLVYSI